MKQVFDFLLAIVGIIFISPILLLIAVAMKLSSKGPVLFIQKRVGKHEEIFFLYKFRTMVIGAEKLGSSVTTASDIRITTLGRFLRKTKLDELPQIFNVLKGDMSFVGPRPEVPEITNNYTPEMRNIFQIKPGITSLATLHLKNEEKILASVANPDIFYEKTLVPLKVKLAMTHVKRNSFFFDFQILLSTIWMLTPFGKLWPVTEHRLVTEMKKRIGVE